MITETGDPDKNASAATRAKAAEAVLRAAHGNESSLLTRVRGAMAVGLCSYYLYLLSCLAVLFAAGLSAAISIINPILLLPLAVGFLFAYLLAMAADRRISNVFSQFWFKQQQHLREALKQARQKVQAEQQNPSLNGTADRYDGLVAPPPSASDGLASIHMSGTQL